MRTFKRSAAHWSLINSFSLTQHFCTIFPTSLFWSLAICLECRPKTTLCPLRDQYLALFRFVRTLKVTEMRRFVACGSLHTLISCDLNVLSYALFVYCLRWRDAPELVTTLGGNSTVGTLLRWLPTATKVKVRKWIGKMRWHQSTLLCVIGNVSIGKDTFLGKLLSICKQIKRDAQYKTLVKKFYPSTI